jgi:hypothetical protein
MIWGLLWLRLSMNEWRFDVPRINWKVMRTLEAPGAIP